MTDMNKEDRELEEIFSGEEKPLHPDTVHITLGKGVSKKEKTTPKEEKKNPHKPTHNFEDGKWEPIKEVTWLDKLKASAKSGLLFGGLTCLIFYWKEAGLMASSIAVPSMCICTAMVGLAIGKASMGGK